MLCCLAAALMAGNLIAAWRIALGFLRRRSVAAAIVLLALAGTGIAVAPALAEHGAHYAARADANHRSVFAEILAAPLCSGEATS